MDTTQDALLRLLQLSPHLRHAAQVVEHRPLAMPVAYLVAGG
jgi:hypothetical protein